MDKVNWSGDSSALNRLFSETEFHRLPQEVKNGWLLSCSSSGWTSNYLCNRWIEHFDKWTRDEADNGNKPRVLTCDGDRKYIIAPITEYTRENNIVILALPPHVSRLLQPLDVSYYHSLEKKNFRRAQQEYYKEFAPSLIRGDGAPDVLDLFKAELDSYCLLNAAFHSRESITKEQAHWFQTYRHLAV